MRWIAGLAMLALACGSTPPTESQCFESGAPRPAVTAAVISPSDICVPAGTLLLIRARETTAALRFHDVRDLDPGRSTGCARYELHTRTDGAWRRIAGTVASLGWYGVHPFVGERGHTTIAGPGVSVQYAHAACVWLRPEDEYAPTGWTSIDDVDPNDPRLQWFRIDKSLSRSVTIPLADLPGVHSR